MTTPADLRSHAIGQRTREMSDDVDPAARSVLEAMERAAKLGDCEWRRLRQVEAAARALNAAWLRDDLRVGHFLRLQDAMAGRQERP